MILQSGDKRREKYLKGGNVLKTMRDAGGWAKGAIGGGAVLLGFGIVLAIPCMLPGLYTAAMAVGGFFGIPGLLLILLGKRAQNKKMKNYLDYYEKETGFGKEELRLINEELMAPDMVMFGNVPTENIQGASKKNPQIVCMITRNYFVVPFIMGESYIRRNSDMILAAYTQQIPGVNGYREGVVFISKKDKESYNRSFVTRDVCGEIGAVLKTKQLGLITADRFEYRGKSYDAVLDGESIVKTFGESV